MGLNNIVQPTTQNSTIGLETLTLGIIKNKNSDVLFSKFPDDLLSFDNMLITAPYQFIPRVSNNNPTSTPTFSSSSTKMITSFFDLPTFEKEILEPIHQIIEDANEKRLELYDLLITNPYFPWYKRKPECLTSCYYHTMWSLSDIPYLGSLLAIFYSVLIGFPLFLLSLLQYLFHYLLDIYFCRLTSCRGSAQEKAVIRRIIENHPELDTIKIDEEIETRINELCLRLKEKFPQLAIQMKKGSEEIVDEKNADFYFLDYFYLLFEKIDNSKTDEMISHMV